MLAGTMKRVALGALAIAFGCSAAAAQTLTASLASDTDGLYATIKEAVQGSYVNAAVKRAIKEKKYILDDCEAPGLIASGPSTSELLDLLAGVAGTAVRVSVDLRKLGYPPEVWETLIQDYERSEIESIRAGASRSLTEEEKNELLSSPEFSDKLYKGLVAASAAYRKAHPSLVRVVVEGSGCGVGEEVEVTVKTRPPGGSVWFISSFDYKLCKSRNLDPEDRNSCDVWQNGTIEGNPPHMLGNYEYVAIWPDRAPARSRLKIGSALNGGDRKTITITP